MLYRMIEKFLKYIGRKNGEFIIFDVGSRDCMQAIEFYNAFPKAKIYAFECNPNTLDICRKNIEKYRDRITLIEGAVCDYNGTIKFYPINQRKTITSWEDGNPGASSIFKSNDTYSVERYVQDEIIVPCHRLDSVMKKYGIPKVDIIWMDLQGAELLALKGLGAYLAGVQYICTEVTYKEIYSGQVMFYELNEYILSNGFTIKNGLTFEGWQEDVIYEKCINMFDIVIPVGPNDSNIIRQQLEYTRNNVIGFRNIYLICHDPGMTIEGCIMVSENIFPFSLETVSSFHGKSRRNGWYLQQLLKLYALITIPNILERCLVIDCDTFFLRPTTFIKDNKCLYNFGTQYHPPYFKHMSKLNKDFVKVDPAKSGICHHMMFEKIYIEKLIDEVERIHNDKFYNVFLKTITDVERSGASEYEIYFNYMLKNYSDQIEIRPLRWRDVSTLSAVPDLDYISYHWYMRK